MRDANVVGKVKYAISVPYGHRNIPRERSVVRTDLGRKTPETMGCRPIFKGSATLPFKIQPTLFATQHKARPKPKNKQQPLRAMKPPTQPLTATIRPLPYYNCPYTPAEAALASELRRDFVPKVARRLPGHHLCGLPHDFVVQWVKKQKKTYPYFLKTDIAKFYPSIRHRDLVVGAQIAYRDLLSLDRVPNNIKKRYVGRLNAWLNALPTAQGCVICKFCSRYGLTYCDWIRTSTCFGLSY